MKRGVDKSSEKVYNNGDKSKIVARLLRKAIGAY